MAGILTVDTIQSDSSYASTLNVASKMNFAAGMQIGGQDATFGGMRNRIINGDMRINQRAFTGTPSNGAYTLDRYFYNANATRITLSQSSTAPAGFANSMFVTSSSAASIAASDFTNICQVIEGYNIADLAWGTADAKPVTLSFWVRSSLTGTFGGALRNLGTGGYWGYPFTYTINAANTWEYKTITIPGATNVSYTWDSTNAQGIYIWWDLGTGSTYTAPAGTWVNKNTVGADGTTKLVTTNGATWHMTGVQLEKGSAATAFENRQFGQELAFCMRYFQKDFQGTWGATYSAETALVTLVHAVPMRANPTLSQASGVNIAIDIIGGAQNASSQAISGSGQSLTRTPMTINGLSGRGTYQPVAIANIGTQLSAEL